MEKLSSISALLVYENKANTWRQIDGSLLQSTNSYQLVLYTNNYILKIQKAATLNNLHFLLIVLFECHLVGPLLKKKLCAVIIKGNLLFCRIQMRRSCQFLFFPLLH